MRVLMTTDTLGGVFTYAVELSRALGEHRVEVHLATLGGPLSPSQRQRLESLANVTVHESRFALEWMDDPWEDVDRSGDWLLDLERRVSPDAVHLNGYAHGALPFRRPPLVVGHSCVLSWFEAVKKAPAPARYDLYRRRVTAGLRAAGVVVTPTAAMRAALERHYGPLPGGRVVPNGRDPARFVPGAKEPLILSAGRLWDEAKNVAALDAVASELPWPVRVAGEPRHPGGGGFEGRGGVRPLGQLSEQELAGWMGRATICALPARYEPFGLTALEAALAGCALVLGDLESLREVWGDAAIYVPPDDHRALGRALRLLIEEPQACALLAARARARAGSFTPARMAGDCLELYRGLASGASAEPGRWAAARRELRP